MVSSLKPRKDEVYVLDPSSRKMRPVNLIRRGPMRSTLRYEPTGNWQNRLENIVGGRPIQPAPDITPTLEPARTPSAPPTAPVNAARSNFAPSTVGGSSMPAGTPAPPPPSNNMIRQPQVSGGVPTPAASAAANIAGSIPGTPPPQPAPQPGPIRRTWPTPVMYPQVVDPATLAKTPLSMPQQNQLPTPINKVYTPDESVDRQRQLSAQVSAQAGRVADQAMHQRTIDRMDARHNQDMANITGPSNAVHNATVGQPNNWRNVPPHMRQNPTIKGSLNYSDIRQNIHDRKQAADDAAYQQYQEQHPAAMSPEEAQSVLDASPKGTGKTRQYVNTGPDGSPLMPGQNLGESADAFTDRRGAVGDAQSAAPINRGQAFRESLIRRNVQTQLKREKEMEAALNSQAIDAQAAAAEAKNQKQEAPKPTYIKAAIGGQIEVPKNIQYQNVDWNELNPQTQNRIFSQWSHLAMLNGGRQKQQEVENAARQQAMASLGIDPNGKSMFEGGPVTPWTDEALQQLQVPGGGSAYDAIQDSVANAWPQYVGDMMEVYGGWTTQQQPGAAPAAGQPQPAPGAAPGTPGAAPAGQADPMAIIQDVAQADGGLKAMIDKSVQSGEFASADAAIQAIANQFGVDQNQLFDLYMQQ